MKLKKSTLFFYSLAEMPINIALFPILVFIPKFYTGEMGVPLALAANIILAVRIFDVFTDPVVGYINDRTNTKWGRRRPWIAIATPLLMVSIYMLFIPPEGAGALHLFLWMFLLSIGTTMLIIPYYAWGAELSPDYNERSRITGWRSISGVVGSLSAQLIPTIALVFFGLGGSTNVLYIVGIASVIIMPICVFLTIIKVPESKDYVQSNISPIKGFKIMLENSPFKRLIMAFMFGGIAFSITIPLYLFFITYVLKAEEMAIFMLTFFYLTNIIAVPFWVWLSKQIGKHKAYMCSFAMIAFAHPFYLLLGEGDFWWMLPITITTGFAAGGFAALPNSMKADVIDLDTVKSGENRSGLFFSSWSLTSKLAGSIGTWLALTALSWISFNTGFDADNSPSQLFGLKFLFSTLPSFFFLTAIFIIWKYPITEEMHSKIRDQLKNIKNERILET